MLRKNTVSICAAVAAAALTASQGYSAELFWATNNTGNLSDAANYTSGVITNPTTGAGDNFNIGAGGTANFPGTTALTAWDPGRLRVGGAFATSPGAGTLNITSGAFTPGGNAANGYDGSQTGFVVGLGANGTVNMSGGSITSTRFIVIGADGAVYNPNAATPTYRTPTSTPITSNGSKGVLNFSGGTIRTSNNTFFVGNGNRGEVYVSGTASLLVESASTTSATAVVTDLVVGEYNASRFDQSGGTVRVSRSFLVGSGSTINLSGGSLTTETKKFNTAGTAHSAGNFMLGRLGSTGDTLNLSGSAVVNVGHRFLMGGASDPVIGTGGTGIVANQTGGTLNVDVNMSISDVAGDSTYNLSGGTINAGIDNDSTQTATTPNGDPGEDGPTLNRVGRRGTGRFFQTGGTANFGSGLAVGDDDGGTTGATGILEISGGTLHPFTAVGQTGAALRVGTAGTGTFRVVGDDGVVNVNGDMVVDNTSKGTGTLAYKFEAGDSLSTIGVTGTATINNLAAVTLDDSGAAPGATSYDLLTASKVINNGAAFTGPAGWNLYVTAGGSGEVLRAIQGTAPTVLYWDTDAATPGSGGATPTGTWDGSTTNFTTSGTGSSATTTAATTAADDVIFSAGADSTGSYTVTVSGTQAAGSVGITRGNVTLTGGTLATGALFVAPGASATINSIASGNGSGAITKTGAGTLTLGAANTMTSTTVSAGTLIAAHGDAFGGGSVNVANGALAQAQASLPKAVTVSTLTTNTSGKFDLANNSMVVKGMADSAVRTQLQAGYNAGAWNGATGIVSTAVTAETSIGYATQAQTGITDFKGVTGMAGTDVLVKFTYAGDANLDGKVDIGDLGLLAGAWQAASGKVWFDGDFTYDGAVDIGDLGLLSGNWQKGTAGNPNPPLMDFATAMAQFSAFDGVVVPEPTGLALVALGGIGLLGRRRRGTR